MSTIYNDDPPRLSANQIENISVDFLNRYVPNVLKNVQPTPISILIEKYLGIDLDFKCLSKDKKILGITVLSDGYVEIYNDKRTEKCNIEVKRGTIIIENDLISNREYGRGRFTMGHEVGHWILHNTTNKTIFRCDDLPRKLQTNNDWFEWQADTFASAVLMPKNTFAREYCHFKKDTKTNRNDEGFVEIVAEHLSNLFQVSYKAAIVRIDKLNLF